MKKLPKISESEWVVMCVLWSKSPLAAQEVFEHLDGTIKWKPKTVKTLIDRLVKKGAVKYEKIYVLSSGRTGRIRYEGKAFIRSAGLRRDKQADARRVPGGCGAFGRRHIGTQRNP